MKDLLPITSVIKCRKNLRVLSVFSVFFILSLFVSQKASATHAAGAEITYQWIGPGAGNYKITYTLYRDCAGINPFTGGTPTNFNLTAKSTSCGIANLNISMTFDNTVVGNGGEIGYQCPGATTCSGGPAQGYQKYVWTGYVNLPYQCTDWVIFFGLASRNDAITTLNSPGGTTLYVEAKLDNVNANHNNSTIFSNYPIVNVCAGQPFTYNPGSLDADGDSISYTLVCAKSSTTNCVSYNSGGGGTCPLQPCGSVILNSSTGDLVISTNIQQIGVVAVLVQEWRLVGGVMKLVGSVVRDMQINVTSCTNVLPTESGINGGGTRTLSVCMNTPISFTINGSDPNNVPVNTQNITMAWNNGIAGATFTVANNNTPNPVATFAWTPTIAGTYQFTVNVHDNFCPTNAYQTYSYTITVKPGASVLASSPTICTGTAVTLTAGGVSNYSWNTGATTTSIFIGAPTSSTTYTVYSADASLCSGFKVVNVTVNPLPTLTPVSSPVCAGNSTTITVTGANSYTWNSNLSGSISASGTTAIITITSPVNGGTYTVTGTSAAGCSNTVSGTLSVNPVPVVTSNTVNVCSGQPATLTASGASSYSWSNAGETTTSITVTIFSATTLTTTYTVWGTTNGCTGYAIATVNTTPNPVVTISPSQSLCTVQCLTLTTGGASSYVWSTGETTTSIVVCPTVNTIYNVTGASNGCSATVSATITINPLPTVNVSNLSVCVGFCKSFTASGTATSYSWSPGTWLNTVTGASPIVCPTSTGTTTYTVVGTNAVTGCTNSTTVTATATSPAVTASNASTCNGTCQTLTASGVSSYAWSPAATLSPSTGASVLSCATATTTYTITGTDANGCVSTKNVTLTVNPLPFISVNSPSICNGVTATLTAVGPGNYSWNTGATTTTLTVTPSTTTLYTVTGTDGNGCTNSAVSTLTVNALPVLSVSAPGTYCSGVVTTLTVSGASSYAWSGPTTISGSGSTVTVAPTGAGNTTFTYTVIGTNSPSGCTSIATVTITISPTTPTVTLPGSWTYCSGTSMDLTASGTPSGGTYVWSAGTPAALAMLSATNLAIVTHTGTNTTSTNASHNYTVVYTSPAGCTATLSKSFVIKPVVPFTVNSLTICNSGSPTATLTSTPAFTYTGNATYKWSGPAGTTSCISQTPGGTPCTVSIVPAPTITTTYTITNTIANGISCIAPTQFATITVVSAPTITILPTATALCGAAASLTLTASGGTSYVWSTGVSTTTASVSPTATTVYTVTGFLPGGCSSTATYTVNPTQPLPSVTTTYTAQCLGTQMPLTAGVTGGTGPYTYSWTPSTFLSSTTANSITATPTSTGSTTYTVTVKDSYGCTQTSAITVTPNPLPTITASSALQCLNSTTVLTASGSGGSGPYSYVWNNTGATTTTISVTPTISTTYTVTGTDQNGCTNTGTRIIGNALPTITASSATVCFNVGSATLTATGGVSYIWTPGTYLSSTTGSSVVTTSSVGTTYTVTGTDANGCTNMATVATNYGTPVITTSANSSVCGTTCVTLTAGGGVTYVWSYAATATAPSSNNGAPVTVCPTATATYTVIGTDANGCTNSETVTITVNPQPTISAGGSSAVCSGTTATLTSSQTSVTSYLWSPGGSTTANITDNPTITTTYTVIGTGAGGCSVSATVTVPVNPLPSPTPIPVSSCIGNSKSLCVIGANTYAWSGPTAYLSATAGACVTASAAAPVGTYTYTIVGTDINNCTSSTTLTYTVNSLPVVTVTPTTNVTYCSGSSTQLTANGASTYFWTPATGLSPSQISNPITHTLTNTTSGVQNYTVTVTGTDANGCSSSASKQITVKPQLNVLTAPASICLGSSATLTVNGSPAGIYNWSWSPGPPSCSSTTNSPCSFTPTPTTTTTYKVQMILGGGCASSQLPPPVTVTVNVVPQVTAGSNGTATVCTGAPVTLTASGGSGAIYVWSPGNLTGSSVSVQPTATTTYTVTASTTSPATCSSSDTTTVVVPTAASVSSSPFCQGDSAQLCASGGGTYSWVNSGNMSAFTGACIWVKPPVTWTYSVYVTDPSGCTSLATATATVDTPSINVPTTLLVCNGSPVTLTASGSNISNYSWAGLGTGASITALPTANTTYTVTGTTASGCSANQTIDVVVPTAFASPATICAGSSAFLFALGVPGATYTWSPDVPTGSIVGQYTNNPTVNPTATTTYSVSISYGACTTVKTATVTVSPPAIVPTVSASAGNDTLFFTKCCGYTYEWYDSTAATGKTDSFFVVPHYPGTYSVKVTSGGCSTFTPPIVSAPIGLPIELLDFSALPTDDYVTLLWATASETNNDYFTVEKSKEGDKFVGFETVPGAGNSTVPLSYHAFDRSPYRPISYYRLKQTDYDGKYSYSHIVAVDFNSSKDDVLNIFPNPTSRAVEYDYISSMDATVVIELSDLTGRIVKSVSVKVIKGRNHLSSDLDGLASGVYHLQFKCKESDFNLVKKVVKF